MYYDELYHHGIRGQRWGVRRFQNLDGTLTKLGKKIGQEIRDRSQFNQLKKNFQTPREFTNDYRWNNHRHSPNAEMYKPSTDSIDPRHYKKDSLFNGPGVDHYKRDWNATPLKSMSKYNQGDRVFQLIDERKAFNEAKNNWQQTPPSFKDDRNSSSFIARDSNGVPRNILPRETNETQVTANARMGRIMPNPNDRHNALGLANYSKKLEIDSHLQSGNKNRLRQQTPIGNVRINSISSSSTRYRQAATRVTSAARSKVSSYATKARTNAGKMFTNYMTKMAEASKTIDADFWSF